MIMKGTVGGNVKISHVLWENTILYLIILFSPACTEAGYNYAGGMCTQYVESDLTWNDARAACKAKGGDLIRFCDASELQVIEQTYTCR